MKKEQQFERGALLKNFINKSWQATTGLSNIAEIECRKLVNQLVTSRKIDANEGAKLTTDLLGKVKSAKSELENKIDAGIENSLKHFDLSTNQEIEKLQKKIIELETSIATLAQR